ncbi:hypothetical protein BDV59DRAFT_172897 [Aspergillus ambiguus]|uniref:uncharacterized protein n=1 Tax=Aspergillus ambiguus TaxID=176160 RepID=UPI003CCD4E97
MSPSACGAGLPTDRQTDRQGTHGAGWDLVFGHSITAGTQCSPPNAGPSTFVLQPSWRLFPAAQLLFRPIHPHSVSHVVRELAPTTRKLIGSGSERTSSGPDPVGDMCNAREWWDRGCSFVDDTSFLQTCEAQEGRDEMGMGSHQRSFSGVYIDLTLGCRSH